MREPVIRHDREGHEHEPGGTPGKVAATSRLSTRREAAPPPAPAPPADPPDHAEQDRGLAEAMGFIDAPAIDVKRSRDR